MFAGEEASGAGDVEGAARGDIEAVPLKLGVLEEGDLGVAASGGAVEVGRGGIGALSPGDGGECEEREPRLHALTITECRLECQDILRRLVG